MLVWVPHQAPGDTVQLRGHPKDLITKRRSGNGAVAELAALGMVTA